MRFSSLAPHARITADNGDLCLDTSYDPALVASLKAAIPAGDRAWDAARKLWRVKPQHGPALIKLCQDYLGITPNVPDATPTQARPQVRVITLHYLGACKQREDGSISAMGYADGAWSIVAPETVLRQWFEGHTINAGQSEPDDRVRPETYYGLLGIPQNADQAAIKAGYRRMARQWHPDVCAEPGAHEMFLAIRAAYNILSEPILRKKYDAGLLFAAKGEQGRAERRLEYAVNYRSPLRCGLIVAEALPVLGRWRLEKIHSWQDITDLTGRVMVASWDHDRERIRTEWVTA